MMLSRILKEMTPPLLRNKILLRKVAPSILLNALNQKRRNQLLYNALYRQIRSIPDIETLFPQDEVRGHYVYGKVRDSVDHPDVFITQLRYYRMYQFFKTHFSEIFSSGVLVLDIGDTSGMFLQALGKIGVSLNINQECVNFIRSRGLEAVQGDAESLDFDDNSFDYIFSFQCLEHLPNPIKALNEWGRVARKKVFLSIPYVDSTRIYNIAYWIDLKRTSWKEDSVRSVDCHIFEFSTKDFINILSYTNLDYERNFPILYFRNNSLRQRLLNKAFGSYFNFFVLKPVSEKKVH